MKVVSENEVRISVITGKTCTCHVTFKPFTLLTRLQSICPESVPECDLNTGSNSSPEAKLHAFNDCQLSGISEYYLLQGFSNHTILNLLYTIAYTSVFRIMNLCVF